MTICPKCNNEPLCDGICPLCGHKVAKKKFGK